MKRIYEILLVAVIIAAVIVVGYNRSYYKGSKKMNKTQAQRTPADPNKYEKATFAAGCFWHVQYDFDQIPGVASTTVGYTGGTTENPTYKQVCAGKTGHAEAVEIIYDPNKVSYDGLLDAFFKMHDPTQLYRQGPDIGYQYRSAIFFHNPNQQKAALAKIDELSKSGKFKLPIVTEVKPASRKGHQTAGPFYKAEDYHQKYVEKHGLLSCPVLFSGRHHQR
jgi:methionine-S-sulfoxide reductase